MISYCVRLFHLVNYDGVKKENYSMKKITLIAFLLFALLACGSKPVEEEQVGTDPIVEEVVEPAGKVLKCYDETMTMYFHASSDSNEIVSMNVINVTSLEGTGITEEQFELIKDSEIQNAIAQFESGVSFTMEIVDGNVVSTFIIEVNEADDYTKDYFNLSYIPSDINEIYSELSGDSYITCDFE